jgi:hypothetical protein
MLKPQISDAKNAESNLLIDSANSVCRRISIKAETAKQEAVTGFIGSHDAFNMEKKELSKTCKEISTILNAKTRVRDIHIVILNDRYKGGD